MSNTLIKVTSGLEVVSKQIGIVNKLLQFNDPPLIPYRRKSKWGFCNPEKKIVLECVFDDANIFSEGLAAVKSNGKWGFINSDGKMLIQNIYSQVSVFSGGLAAVILNSRLGYIDSTGKQIIPCRYHGFIWETSLFSEGLAAVQRDGKFGFIDKAGNQKIAFLYDDVITGFFNGVAWVETADDSEGYDSEKFSNSLLDFFIDATGKKVQIENTNEYHFREGLRSYALPPNMKSGFVDKKYNVIIPCIFDYARNFSQGLAAVQLNGKWGFIDKTGKQVIQCVYDSVEDFFHGLALVKYNNRKGYINKAGQHYWDD